MSEFPHLKAQVNFAVDQAIKSFDFDAEMERMAGSILRNEIRQALERAFRAIVWDSALSEALVAHMLRELRRADPTTDGE